MGVKIEQEEDLVVRGKCAGGVTALGILQPLFLESQNHHRPSACTYTSIRLKSLSRDGACSAQGQEVKQLELNLGHSCLNSELGGKGRVPASLPCFVSSMIR